MADQIKKSASLVVVDWESVLAEIRKILQSMEERKREHGAEQKRFEDLVAQLPDGLRGDIDNLIKSAETTQLPLLPPEVI